MHYASANTRPTCEPTESDQQLQLTQERATKQNANSDPPGIPDPQSTAPRDDVNAVNAVHAKLLPTEAGAEIDGPNNPQRPAPPDLNSPLQGTHSQTRDPCKSTEGQAATDFSLHQQSSDGEPGSAPDREEQHCDTAPNPQVEQEEQPLIMPSSR